MLSLSMNVARGGALHSGATPSNIVKSRGKLLSLSKCDTFVSCVWAFSLSASATSEPPQNSLSLTVFSSDVILADGGGKSDRQAAKKNQKRSKL